MVDVHWTIYYLKNNRNYFTNSYDKMKDIVNFVEKNNYIFDNYLNDEYGVDTYYNIFKNCKSGDGYYSTVTDFADYFKDNIFKIRDSITHECKKILKEVDDMKSQVKEMSDFINKYHLTYLPSTIGAINKRTPNKDLNYTKEEYLPYKDEIIDGCKNILGFNDVSTVEDIFTILELDNQTIKENA